MKIRAGFVSNSSSASFLLAVAGDINEGVVSFLTAHADALQKFISGPKSSDDWGPEYASEFTPDFIAECIAKKAKPLDVDITVWVRRWQKELAGIPAQYRARQKKNIHEQQDWLRFLAASGVPLYLFSLERQMPPESFIVELFQDVFSKLRDPDFSLTWLPEG
jgi:hypothetical protein